MTRPVALAFALTFLLASLPVPSAAQEPEATLTLLAKTAWNDPERAEVELRVQAENVGAVPIDDLALGLTLWAPVNTRSQYEASLAADPLNSVQLLAKPLPRRGTLAPGDARIFETTLELPLDRLDLTSSRVYPLTVDLRSGFTSLAAVRTSVIFIAERPKTPLQLSWTFVVSAPLMTGPDGVFTSSALETSVSPGGRLAGMLTGLDALAAAGVAVDVAVSPTLLLQLEEMRDGYSVAEIGDVRSVPEGSGGSVAAAAALARLRAIAAAPNVELSALPFAAPLLPALAAGGLSGDVRVQLEEGREVVTEILGHEADATILRPPGSALDRDTLDALDAQGIDLLLIDAATAPPAEQELGFAPPPTTALPSGDGEIQALVSDPNVATLLGSTLPLEDPVRAAHAVVGELAQIWLESPSVERGLAVVFGESPSMPGPFFTVLARAVADAPWLSHRTASTLAAAFPPDGRAPSFVPSTAAFSQSYAEALKQARRRIRTLEWMLVDPSDEPDRLATMLLLAEAGRFVGAESTGSAFITHVHRTVDQILGGVHPVPDQVFTLTATAGSVPVRIANDTNARLRVLVRLQSNYLVGENVQQTVVLPAATTRTLSFDVEMLSTGRREALIRVLPPVETRRPRVIAEAKMIVRSTAYNRIALWITLGAAALALLVWARRFLPRTAT